ncbi:MAG: periplasmic stress adaptor protein CpxP [Elusimicrobia bacterium ADurb.Bin231]|nr:MAG: periplasmic stress adaptor protein CpxP [Elusimicrobia bacterium ADurb.Bin231]
MKKVKSIAFLFSVFCLFSITEVFADMLSCSCRGGVPCYCEDGISCYCGEGALAFKKMSGKKKAGSYNFGKKKMGPEGEMDCTGMYLGMKEELGLSEEQIKTIESIGMEQRKSAVKRKSDIEIFRIELAELFRKEPPDFKAAKEKVKKISDVQLEMKISMIDSREKIYNVLTKEQREKLIKARQDRRKKGKSRSMKGKEKE